MSQPFFRYADTVGDGSGTIDFNGDYRDPEGSGPEVAYVTAAKAITIERMLVSVGDTAGMQAQEYGNLGAALGNGIEVKLYDHNDVEVVDCTDGEPITTNSEWGALCFDVDLKTWGAGNELLVVRWTFAKSGSPLKLDPGWYLAIELGADNLSGLLSHRFQVQGV